MHTQGQSSSNRHKYFIIKNMLGMFSHVLMLSLFHCFHNKCCIEELLPVSPEPGWIPPSADGFYRGKSVMELENRKEGGRKRQ